MFWKKQNRFSDSEVIVKRFEAIDKRLDELCEAVSKLQLAIRPHHIYAPGALLAHWNIHTYPKPMVSISLWDMIHKLREHVGLEIEAKASTPATWELVKRAKK